MGWILFGFLTVIFAEMLIRVSKGYKPTDDDREQKRRHRHKR